MPKALAQLMADAKRGGWSEWIRSEADERAVLEGYEFNRKLGEHVVEFFETHLCLGEGQWAGQPFELMDWQRDDVIMPLFGWVRHGIRRFRDAYVSCPKKSGKSPLAAGIGLYLLVGDGEPGAKVASVATEIQQANIVHQEAIRMVKASPELRAVLKINHTTSNIGYASENAWYRAFSGEAESKEGYNLHGAIADELHVWRGTKLLDTLRYAFISRRQPLFFKITTAGVYDETSVGWEEYIRAKRVRDGEVVDLEKFVYISEAPKDADWTAPETWRIANPSLGVTVREDELAKACGDAQETPRLENEFRRYRLNQWTETAERWLDMTQWAECSAKPEIPEKAICGACGDLSSKLDLTAFAVAWYDENGECHVEVKCFLPESQAQTRRKNPNQPLYAQWAKDGYLELTPGNVIDYKYLRARIREMSKRYRFPEIGMDPANASKLLVELAEEDGFTVFEHRQGFLSMNEPSKELERLLVAGLLRHGGNPVLTWAAQNATVRTDPAGSIKPEKPKKSSPLKIDPLVAVIMAVGRAMMRPKDHASVYETRGVLAF